MAETAPSVDLVICRELAGIGPCTFDELAHRLSPYSWAQVFSAVDRLSRKGTISVSRARGVDYVVSNRAGRVRRSSFAHRKAQGRELAER